MRAEPGEGARILEPVVGSSSVILLDESAHLGQRRLMLPAFHGEKMQQLSDLVTEVTEREVAAWSTGRELPLHPRLKALTLEVILRAVFGLDRGRGSTRCARRSAHRCCASASPHSPLRRPRAPLDGGS